MRGIVLAGGSGSRLHPLTRATNKHLLPVHDKPMVHYPLTTLMTLGVREVLLITTPADRGGFERLLGDGSGLGLRLRYAVQERPEGLAQALTIGADFCAGGPVALVLGDNVFHGPDLAPAVRAAWTGQGALVLAQPVPDPRRYAVVELDGDGRPVALVEKPADPRSTLAVPGLYLYDGEAAAVAAGVRPGARGELEITAVNEDYLRRGRLRVAVLPAGTAWFDAGTLDSLAAASASVRRAQETTGRLVGSPEEVAWRQGWIDDEQLRAAAEPLRASGYGDRLLACLAERAVVPAPRPAADAVDDPAAGQIAVPGAPLHVGAPNIGDRAAFARHVDTILTTRRLSNDGPMVRELERRLAEHLRVRHVVAVSNATVGLQLAAVGLGLRGEVVVPSFTFVATAHALAWVGLRPVFADIDVDTHCLDPQAVRRAITPRTAAVLAVHLWGRPAPVEALQEVADEHGVPLFLDAAHAFGVSHRGRMVGSFGAAEVFSFHATKFFNTFEGGAVTTDDDDLAETLRRLRAFGFRGQDDVGGIGTNGKLSEVCAAMGLVNLDALPGVVARNREVHRAYRRGLARVPDVRLLEPPAGELGNHQYVVVEVEDGAPGARDEVLAALRARGVLARRYFWPGCHRMSPYAEQDPDAGARLPVTELVADRVLVLPAGGALTPPAVEAVVGIVDRVMSTRASDRRLRGLPRPSRAASGSGAGSSAPVRVPTNPA